MFDNAFSVLTSCSLSNFDFDFPINYIKDYNENASMRNQELSRKMINDQEAVSEEKKSSMSDEEFNETFFKETVNIKDEKDKEKLKDLLVSNEGFIPCIKELFFTEDVYD